MTLSLERIQQARDAGYDDETILSSIEKNDEEFGSRIKKARESGYDSDAIMQSINNRLSQVNQFRQQAQQEVSSTEQPEQLEAPTPAEKVIDIKQGTVGQQQPQPQPEKPADLKPTKEQSRLMDAFKKGLKGSVSGGAQQEEVLQDESFWESIVQEAGTFTGDTPYFIAGGTLGTTMGAALGSYGGPFGTAAGGLIGGAAGAMALPAFLKASINEYRDYVNQGNDLTFGEFLQKADSVASETLNAGLFGAILGSVSKAVPILQKIPGIGKLFTSKIAQKAATITGEATIASFLPAAVEGRLPTKEDVAKAFVLTVGMNAIHAPEKLVKYASEKVQKKYSPEAPKSLEQVKKVEKLMYEIDWENPDASKTKQQIDEAFDKVFTEEHKEKIVEKESSKKIQKQTENIQTKEAREDIKTVKEDQILKSEEQISKEKTQVQEKVNEMPKNNKRKLVEKAVQKDQVRTPAQLDNFIQEYDIIYPELKGTVADKNRKFLNKYSEKNIKEREFKQIQEPTKVPTPKASNEFVLNKAQQEYNQAKREGDKQKIKEAKKNLDLIKDKIQNAQKQADIEQRQAEIKKAKEKEVKAKKTEKEDKLKAEKKAKEEQIFLEKEEKRLNKEKNLKLLDEAKKRSETAEKEAKAKKKEKEKVEAEEKKQYTEKKLKDKEQSDKLKKDLKKKEEEAFKKSVAPIQKKIDDINIRITKTKDPEKLRILNKNKNIQEENIKKQRKAFKYSVPETPAEVTTKEPTAVFENKGAENPNVIQAVVQNPVKVISQGAYPEDPYTRILKKAKKKSKSFLKKSSEILGLGEVFKEDTESEIFKKSKRAKEDYFSQKVEIISEFHDKFEKAFEGVSKSDLHDAIFYRERTGNPTIKGDTFEALEKRMSTKAKNAVDTVVDQHMKMMLDTINEAPFIKDKINARQEVMDIYIRHMYKGKISQEKLNKLFDKKFVTGNPFKNKRTFLTFEQAMQEAGLVPKYEDIKVHMAAQDAILARVMSNNKLVSDIYNTEVSTGQKLIVRSNEKVLYEKARKEGWVPFQDAYMRSYVDGKTKDGKLKWSVTEGPALVHPDLAYSMETIFNKDMYRPDNIGLRIYDGAVATLNKVHVSASAFHIGALMESSTTGGGFFGSAIQGKSLWKKGEALLKDTAIRVGWEKDGLVIHKKNDLKVKDTKTVFQRAVEALKLEDFEGFKKTRNLLKSINFVSKSHEFIFTELHPRLKLLECETYLERTLAEYNKRGEFPNEELLRDIRREIASTVNDQFGGQNQDLMPFYKRNRKALGRTIAFVDWTASAIREVSQAFLSESPIRRKLGREYLARYAATLFITSKMANFFTTGFGNNPDGSVSWSFDRAKFNNQDDPSQSWYSIDIAMPDMDVDILGNKINIGRDENGRRIYFHMGKKLLEIFRYFKHPLHAAFTKSSPILHLLTNFMFDHTPTEEGLYPVRGKYVEGEFRPWNGSRVNSKERYIEYVKHLGVTSTPYAVQSIANDFSNSEKGFGEALVRTGVRLVTSGFGIFSQKKATSLRSSQDFFENAYKIENPQRREESLKALRAFLRDQGYDNKQIKRVETTGKNRVKKKKQQL